jgi:hypothetical protein
MQSGKLTPKMGEEDIIMHTQLREKLMDLRDERVVYQRKAIALANLELWEPDALTARETRRLRYYRRRISEIAAQEQEVRRILWALESGECVEVAAV